MLSLLLLLLLLSLLLLLLLLLSLLLLVLLLLLLLLLSRRTDINELFFPSHLLPGPVIPSQCPPTLPSPLGHLNLPVQETSSTSWLSHRTPPLPPPSSSSGSHRIDCAARVPEPHLTEQRV